VATIHVNRQGVGAGTTGNDTIYGDNRINILGGTKGNDALWGRGGADIIGGAAGNDTLYGDGGNDILSGGLGRDTLTGGAGQDIFIFDARPSASTIDTITDFRVKDDTIWLDKRIFTAAGKANAVLSAAAFWKGDKAHDSSDRIIYNDKTGVVSYDPDGTGAKAAVDFAKIKDGLALTYKDFAVIAV
jgi:Ca2+-binding RTX toxin-like protein